MILLALLLTAAAAADITSVPLNNGLTFPAVSFGLQVYDNPTASKLTTVALKAGIRNFFASVLAQNQKGFGQAIAASNVPRQDIFICGSAIPPVVLDLTIATPKPKQRVFKTCSPLVWTTWT